MAAVNVGEALRRGRGAAADAVEARRWFGEAARGHAPEGMMAYADACREGRGGPRDLAAAARAYAVCGGLGSGRSGEAWARLAHLKANGAPRDLGGAAECAAKAAVLGFGGAPRTLDDLRAMAAASNAVNLLQEGGCLAEARVLDAELAVLAYDDSETGSDDSDAEATARVAAAVRRRVRAFEAHELENLDSPHRRALDETAPLGRGARRRRRADRAPRR